MYMRVKICSDELLLGTGAAVRPSGHLKHVFNIPRPVEDVGGRERSLILILICFHISFNDDLLLKTAPERCLSYDGGKKLFLKQGDQLVKINLIIL